MQMYKVFTFQKLAQKEAVNINMSKNVVVNDSLILFVHLFFLFISIILS